ncbi:hypothetical protein [Alicyclobacillus sp. SO9]|uniref:hypothetical protein n=1 Tax=Alicyclobacillus sp. SO9 TaxID=2665646 RepID=UPI0018E74602|nr:hypothetical protein [Alicyclobacillus sp. SO9]QQE80006.1 hypothetical protein GI364_05910 [Alicyclobacillus sp. SO9]
MSRYQQFATACLTLSIAGILVGCGSEGNGSIPTTNSTGTTAKVSLSNDASNHTKMVANSTNVQKSSSNPLFQTTLKLPNGKVVKPNNSVRWKDLSIQLIITSPQSYRGVIGNHSTVISHTSVFTSAGPATLVLNKRTQPAASESNAVTHEYWVIVNRSQYAYAIDATVMGNLKKSKSEVMQLLKQWQIPN